MFVDSWFCFIIILNYVFIRMLLESVFCDNSVDGP